MAALITIAIVAGVAALLFVGYLWLCLAMGREDRTKGSLRSDATSPSARSARKLVGLSGSKGE